MKRKIIAALIVTSFLSGILSLSLNAQEVKFNELPKPVQNAIRGQAGIARVENINIVTRNGKTNYNVAFKREGKPVELSLDSTGNPLTNGLSATQATAASPPRAPLSAASKVTLATVPPAVQRALKKYAHGAEIEDIDKGTLQGRTVYEGAFKNQGENVELRVAEDGSLVKDQVNERFVTQFVRQNPPANGVGLAPSWQILP